MERVGEDWVLLAEKRASTGLCYGYLALLGTLVDTCGQPTIRLAARSLTLEVRKSTQLSSLESPRDQVFIGTSSEKYLPKACSTPAGKYLPSVKQLARSQQGNRASSSQT